MPKFSKQVQDLIAGLRQDIADLEAQLPDALAKPGEAIDLGEGMVIARERQVTYTLARLDQRARDLRTFTRSALTAAMRQTRR